MSLRHRSIPILLAAAVVVFTLLGVAACSSGSGGATSGGSSGLKPSSDPALDAGRVLVESKCKLCHTLDRVKTAKKDGAGWTATVERMRKNGAVLSDTEAQQIIDYLASR